LQAVLLFRQPERVVDGNRELARVTEHTIVRKEGTGCDGPASLEDVYEPTHGILSRVIVSILSQHAPSLGPCAVYITARQIRIPGQGAKAMDVQNVVVPHRMVPFQAHPVDSHEHSLDTVANRVIETGTHVLDHHCRRYTPTEVLPHCVE